MMPEIGEIRRAKEIGFTGRCHKLVWLACGLCGKQRWVRIRYGKPTTKVCRACVASYLHSGRIGADSTNWKGGKREDIDGYIEIWLNPNDFFYSMTGKRAYVKEHRLVMAQHIGRCLQPWEIVHHKNGIKDDNRIENLELSNRGSHTIAHNRGYRDGYLKGLIDGHESRIKQLEARITLLEAENTALKSEQVKPNV